MLELRCKSLGAAKDIVLLRRSFGNVLLRRSFGGSGSVLASALMMGFSTFFLVEVIRMRDSCRRPMRRSMTMAAAAAPPSSIAPDRWLSTTNGRLTEGVAGDTW